MPPFRGRTHPVCAPTLSHYTLPWRPRRLSTRAGAWTHVCRATKCSVSIGWCVHWARRAWSLDAVYVQASKTPTGFATVCLYGFGVPRALCSSQRTTLSATSGLWAHPPVCSVWRAALRHGRPRGLRGHCEHTCGRSRSVSHRHPIPRMRCVRSTSRWWL